MPLLYDAYGHEIRDGVTRDDIIAAIQAAAIADEFSTAQDIADRHGWKSVCLNCAIKRATVSHYNRHGGPWRVCGTCLNDLEAKLGPAASTRMYLDGLLKRNVQ